MEDSRHSMAQDQRKCGKTKRMQYGRVLWNWPPRLQIAKVRKWDGWSRNLVSVKNGIQIRPQFPVLQYPINPRRESAYSETILSPHNPSAGSCTRMCLNPQWRGARKPKMWPGIEDCIAWVLLVQSIIIEAAEIALHNIGNRGKSGSNEANCSSALLARAPIEMLSVRMRAWAGRCLLWCGTACLFSQATNHHHPSTCFPPFNRVGWQEPWTGWCRMIR